jgi:hypothetical protein
VGWNVEIRVVKVRNRSSFSSTNYHNHLLFLEPCSQSDWLELTVSVKFVWLSSSNTVEFSCGDLSDCFQVSWVIMGYWTDTSALSLTSSLRTVTCQIFIEVQRLWESYPITNCSFSSIGPPCGTSCDPNPCRNGGECEESSESAAGYACACLEGFTGLRCDTPVNINCLSYECQRETACSLGEHVRTLFLCPKWHAK